jgi:hypothetical protein
VEITQYHVLAPNAKTLTYLLTYQWLGWVKILSYTTLHGPVFLIAKKLTIENIMFYNGHIMKTVSATVCIHSVQLIECALTIIMAELGEIVELLDLQIVFTALTTAISHFNIFHSCRISSCVLHQYPQPNSHSGHT